MKSTDDAVIARRKTPPYWWPDANVIMQIILVCSIVVMVGYILHQILEGNAKFDQAQRDLLMILLGVVLACFKDVFGYTFGSSAGQKRQGEIITQSLQDKDRIIADNVVTTAATADTTVIAHQRFCHPHNGRGHRCPQFLCRRLQYSHIRCFQSRSHPSNLS